MKKKRPRLLTIESPVFESNVMLRLLEPPGSCRDTLRERIYSGSYDKPFIVDNGRRRFLHFDFGAIQSAMELHNPHGLVLAYTRKMMAFLLFNRTPKHILLLGLGGGSLAKFCYSNLPDTSVTAIEVNEDVVALRDEFGTPADDHRFRVINADAADYISVHVRPMDVILADACDRRGMAPDLGSVEFYRKARGCLTADGIFVVNVCGDKESTAAHLAKLRKAFNGKLLSLQVQSDSNIIVFGFKGKRPKLHRGRLEANAIDLKCQFQLDFPKYAHNIIRHPGSARPRLARA